MPNLLDGQLKNANTGQGRKNRYHCSCNNFPLTKHSKGGEKMSPQLFCPRNDQFCSEVLLSIATLLLKKKSFPDISQFIADEILKDFPVARCCIYKITAEDTDWWAEIIAGIPGHAHGVGLHDPLSMHPDIEDIIKTGKITRDSQPLQNPRIPDSLKKIIEEKQINEIVYFPFLNKQPPHFVVVIETIGEKKTFSDEEIASCTRLTKFINRVAELYEANKTREIPLFDRDFYEKILVEIRQAVAAIGGYASRLKKDIDKQNFLEAESHTSRIEKEVKKLEDIISFDL